MTPRECVLACLAGEKPDRVPMRDAPLALAIERWEREGMPKGGFPSFFFENCIDGGSFDDSLRLPSEVLEDDGVKRVGRDSNGVVYMSLVNSSSTSHPVEFLIKTREDWNRYKDRIVPDPSRISPATLDQYRQWSRTRQSWLCLSLVGAYGHMNELVGTERTLEIMAEDPDWFRDVAETYADYHIGMLELLRAAGINNDGIFQYDDITYITGPFFSPAMYRELIMPSEKRLYNYVHDHGGHVYRHTDGNNWTLLPLLLGAGIDFLDPLEVKAGMDLQEVQAAFGRKAVWVGNVDARVLYRGDRAEIEAEVRRKLAVFPDGGYIYRTDGPITEQAGYDSYRWLIECVRKYGGA